MIRNNLKNIFGEYYSIPLQFYKGYRDDNVDSFSFTIKKNETCKIWNICNHSLWKDEYMVSLSSGLSECYENIG